MTGYFLTAAVAFVLGVVFAMAVAIIYGRDEARRRNSYPSQVRVPPALQGDAASMLDASLAKARIDYPSFTERTIAQDAVSIADQCARSEIELLADELPHFLASSYAEGAAIPRVYGTDSLHDDHANDSDEEASIKRKRIMVASRYLQMRNSQAGLPFKVRHQGSAIWFVDHIKSTV